MINQNGRPETVSGCLRRSAVWGASIWGTEGREFKSPQPDNKNRRSAEQVGVPCQGEGRGFESRRPLHWNPLLGRGFFCFLDALHPSLRGRAGEGGHRATQEPLAWVAFHDHYIPSVVAPRDHLSGPWSLWRRPEARPVPSGVGCRRIPPAMRRASTPGLGRPGPAVWSLSERYDATWINR